MKQAVFAILVITLCLWLCSSPSWGGYWDAVTVDWCVSTSGNDSNDGLSWESPKKTIGAAMYLAQPEEVIGVAAGTYNENLRLTEGVTLLGEGSATTRVQSSLDIVLLARQAESGTVSGFTFAFTGSAAHSTVVLENSAVTITDCVITGSTRSGLDIRGGALSQIKNSEIRNNAQSGIIIHSGGVAIVSRNVIYNNGGRGISIYSGSVAQVTYNTIVKNTYEGIQVDKDSPSSISNNIIVQNGITKNTVGISTVSEPASGSGPNVSYNDVWGNGWGDYEGIEKPDTDISVDPLFVDSNNNDYHLQASSLCRGAAENGGDLGAYSSEESVQIAITISPSEATLQAGATQQFTADRVLLYYTDMNTNGEYDPGEPYTIMEDENTSIALTWEVEGDIGTISSTGLFTAKYVGNGRISATQTSDTSVSGKTGTITVNTGALAKLNISNSLTQINAGGTHQFTVSGEDLYGNSIYVNSSDVTWSVSEDIGTVDETGLFTAITVGTGSVVATLKTNTNITVQSAAFTVTEGDPELLIISQESLTLKLDETYQFTVTGEDAYGNPISVSSTSVSWSVNGGIGAVSTTGVFTATAMGTGSVKATLKSDSSITAQSGTITVVPGDVATLTISQPPPILMAGETNQFTITGADAYGNSVSVEENDISWSVNNDIGTISENGLFSATTTGTGTVKATLKTDSSITAQSSVFSVTANVLAKLTIPSTPSQIEAGETYQFTFYGDDAYSNSVSVNNSEVSWSTSGGTGTISSTGLFTATIAGTGTVTITLNADPSITAQSGTFTVVAGAPQTLAISQAPSTMKAGETNQFTVTGEDAYGNVVSVGGSEVSWSVDGNIGTVSEAGLFSATSVGTGSVKAVLKADSSITAQSETIAVEVGKLVVITLSQAPTVLKIDETHQFTITGADAYENNVSVDCSEVSWFVNGEIGTVSETGLFTATAIGAGSVEVTLKCDLTVRGRSETFNVVVGNIASLTMSQARPTLKAGRIYNFNVTAKDSQGNTVSAGENEIAWSVNGNIGTVSSTGVFTATTVGTGTVQATSRADSSVTAQSGTITVIAGDLAMLTLSQPPATMKAGGTNQFTVTGADAYGNSISVGSSDVSWSVNGSIGTVSSAGLFSAVTAGAGSVKVTLKTNSSITAQSESITVVPGDPATLKISQTPVALKAGKTHQFTVTSEDTYGNNVSVSDITWSVNGGVGTVSETGLFSAITVGTGSVEAVLTADSSITAQSGTITVTAGDLTALNISQPPATMKAGETNQFTVSGADAYGNSVSVESGDVSWSIIGSIGVIDVSGLFTATTTGTGNIEAFAKAAPSATTSTESISVEPGETSVIAMETSAEILLADSISQATITTTVTDAYDNLINTETVSMTATGGIGSLGTVNNNGDGTYTAIYTVGKQTGAVEIQASVANGTTGNISITQIRLSILTCTPEFGTAGETVGVFGSNFVESERAGALMLDGVAVEVYPLGDTVVSAGEIYANDIGEFAVQFAIPTRPGGIHTISVGEFKASLEINGKIAVSPEWGDVGTTIEVIGDGFGQSESIEISFGDTPSIALAMSGNDGAFQASFSVDDQDAGQKSVVAEGVTSGISAEVSFNMTPATISMNLAAGEVGTSIELTGIKFAPSADIGGLTMNGVDVSVTGVDGTSVVDNSIWTDDTGTFVVAFSVPLLPGGDHLIKVGDAERLFTINARITSVQPISGPPDTTVSVAGDGFGAAETISVDFGDTTAIINETTLSDGSFQISFQTNEQEVGMKTIVITGMDSGYFAEADFDLLKRPSPPLVTLISTYDEWENGMLTAEAEAEDLDGVIKQALFQYSLDGVTWHNIATDTTSPYSVDWNTIEALPPVQSGIWIKVVVTDDDSLTQEDATDTCFSVDNEPPATQNDYNDTWHNKNISITLTAGDGAGSGVASIGYKVNDGGTKSIPSGGQAVIDTDGDNSKIEYWAVDNAGNEEDHHILSGIKLDKTPPSLSDWSMQPANLDIESVNDFTIRVKATDNLSGYATPQIAYHISSSYGNYMDMTDADGGYWTFSISGNWSDHPDETLYCKVRLEDNVGNVVEEEKSLLIRDKRPSAITVELPSDSEIQWNENIIVSGDIRDLAVPPIATDFGGAMVSLTFILPGGTEQHVENVETLSTAGDFSLTFSQERFPDLSKHTGTWRVKASWSGNDTHIGSESQEWSFEVVKVTSQMIWDENNAKQLEIIEEGSVSLTGTIVPNPGIVGVTLLKTRPDGSQGNETTNTTASGVFTFATKVDTAGEWKYTVSWTGNSEYNKTSTNEHVLAAKRTIGKAIIVQGGGNSGNSPTFETLGTLADHIYRVFAQRRFTEDDIYYLSPEQQTQTVDEVTSLKALEYAMTTWAPENLDTDLSLYICILTKSMSAQGMVMEINNGAEVFLTASALDGWLDQLQDKCKDITVVIESCSSAEFIATLSAPKRVIISSSQTDGRAAIMKNISFSTYLFDQIAGNQNLKAVFESASGELSSNKRIFGTQKPQLDADGDGVPNEYEDMSAVEGKYIDGDYESKANQIGLPEVLQVSEDQELAKDESVVTVWAETSLSGGNGSVWGTIVPPDFAEGASGADECFLSDANLSTVDLKLAAEDRYEGECKGLDKEGTYTILIYAENAEGISIPMVTHVTVPSKQAVEPEGKQTSSWGDVKNGGLAEAIPTGPGLWQNYPNPFNPDTWIPYQLSAGGDVVLSIYDTSGRLVRRLEIGYKSPGYYMSKPKALYWDGRNNSGEEVASGTYFYCISAGDFTAIRKLLILR